MKKSILFAGALFAALSLAPKASAVTFTYSDADTIGTTLKAGSAVDTYSGTFDFTAADATPFFNAFSWPSEGTTLYSNPGFTLGQTAISASFKFFFRGAPGSEDLTVELDNVSFASLSNFDGYVDLAGGGSIGILGTINASGVLSYTVTADTGLFHLAGAYGSIVATVPEGGTTLAMLGGGMLGMIALRKRFSNKG